MVKKGHRQYYILVKGLELEQREEMVDGVPVQLEGWEQYEFFRHRYRSKWVISEAQTGMAIVSARTVEEVMIEIRLTMRGRKEADVKAAIAREIKIFGERTKVDINLAKSGDAR